MLNLILHIPHASTNIPIKEGYVVQDKILQNEILKLTDWYTDELFYSEKDTIVKADFSRVFCDVERFADDEQEEMAKFGMGVLYEKTDAGETLRNINPLLRKTILENYYWLHHQKLSFVVSQQLKTNQVARIIDCHSFPDVPFNCSINKDENRPDFNIGTDKYHTPQILIDFALDFFKNKGYSVGLDWPYSGSIVPLEYYENEPRVQSIMIEVNRKLYLNDNTNHKSDNFSNIKNVISEFLEIMKTN